MFYKKLMNDPDLEPFFRGVDMVTLIAKQNRFLAYAFGATTHYHGKGGAGAGCCSGSGVVGERCRWRSRRAGAVKATWKLGGNGARMGRGWGLRMAGFWAHA